MARYEQGGYLKISKKGVKPTRRQGRNVRGERSDSTRGGKKGSTDERGRGLQDRGAPRRGRRALSDQSPSRRSSGERPGSGGEQRSRGPARGTRSRSSAERVLVGRNVVLELLRHRRDRVDTVLIADGLDEAQITRDVEDVLSDAVSGGSGDKHLVRIVEVSRRDLAERSGLEAHQGVGVVLRGKLTFEADSILSTLPPHCRLIVLDGVTDPQNIGAIIRAAGFFGVYAVLWSHNRAPDDITPALGKASAGGIAHVKVGIVANIAEILRRLEKLDVWCVLADRAEGHEGLEPIALGELPSRAALVLGSEGDGARRLTRERCDFVISIPGAGAMDSLNVSQATSIILSADTHARRKV